MKQLKLNNIAHLLIVGFAGLIWGILMFILIKDKALSLVFTVVGAFFYRI